MIDPKPGAKLLIRSIKVDEGSIDSNIYISEPAAINIETKEMINAVFLLKFK